MKQWHVNVPYLVVFCGLLAIEILIAMFVRDRFVRPYLGDVLVVVLLYCLIRAFWRPKTCLLPLWVFLFAAVVELCQYFHLAELLHLERYRILYVILGSTFDVADLLCYAAGGILLFLWQAAEQKKWWKLR